MQDHRPSQGLGDDRAPVEQGRGTDRCPPGSALRGSIVPSASLVHLQPPTTSNLFSFVPLGSGSSAISLTLYRNRLEVVGGWRLGRLAHNRVVAPNVVGTPT